MPQPEFSGAQFNISDGVNQQTGVYYIQYHKTVGLQDDGFIAVWQQYTHTSEPNDRESSIRAQVFNADGSKRGTEFKVSGPIKDTSPYLGNDLDVGAPHVAVLSDGRVVIAWTQQLHHLSNSDDRSDARYRVLNPQDGSLTAVAAVFPEDYDEYDYFSDGVYGVAGTVDGGFLIGTTVSINGGAETKSFAAVAPSGGMRLIADRSPGYSSDITSLKNGGWVSANLLPMQNGSYTGYRLEANVWQPDGSSPTTISFSGNFAAQPSIISLTNGNFVVVWEHSHAFDGDGSGTSIKARLFRNDGTAASSEIMVNTTTAQHQMNPVVEALPGGGFVVAFQNGDGHLNQDIRVATFNAAGGRTSDDFLAATSMPGQQIDPSIAVLKDGRFVVSWRDLGFSLRAQIFDSGIAPDPNPDPDPIPNEQTLPGGAGDDVLNGTAIAGLIDGREGFDTVTYASSQGHVVVFLNPAYAGFNQGDAARDRYTSIEAFIGTDFDDQFFGDGWNNQIFGGKGNDLIEGGQGNDSLVGGEGNDTLVGGLGVDTLDGGAGDNVFFTDNQDVTFNATGSGTQTVQTSASFALSASAQIDVLKATAKAGAINLTGNGFQNTIIGNASKNTLKGQGGNDKIYGGAGKDALSGGAGKDIFVFDTKARTGNHDTITDFSVKYDSLWLDNAIFAKLGKAGSEAKPVQVKKSFFVVGDKAQDANDYLVYNRETGVLSYDADGSGKGSAVEIATFSNKAALTFKDFFVV